MPHSGIHHYLQDILNLYHLLHLCSLRNNLTSKEKWKLQVKSAVNKYGTELLQREAIGKSTLKYVNIYSLKIGHTHAVWSSLESTLSDVRKGITKSRMLSGTYLLQANRCKFSKSAENSTCKCCGVETEDIVHMLLDCPAMFIQRKQYFTNLKSLIINCIGIKQWQSNFDTKEK